MLLFIKKFAYTKNCCQTAIFQKPEIPYYFKAQYIHS